MKERLGSDMFSGTQVVVAILELLVILLSGLEFQSILQTNTNSFDQAVEPTPTVAISASPTQLQPSPTSNSLEAMTPAQVVSVVDGDTIKVSLNDKTETVRLIGIDTPETVKPRSPVQCYGKEATNNIKRLVDGNTVYLEADPSQDDRDRYGRLLRFVFLSDGTDVGLRMIEEGFAHEYTYDKPYKYQQAYLAAQENARKEKRGLWSDMCEITASPTMFQ